MSTSPQALRRTPRSLDYLGASAGVVITVLAAFLTQKFIPYAQLSLVFLTGVLVVAARFGLGPSLFAGVLAFMAFNFFFTRPYYTFAVEHEADLTTLLVFLVVAAITGQLAGRMHDEFSNSRRMLGRTTTLYSFARRMAAAADTDDVLRELAKALHELLQVPVAVLVPDTEGRLQVRHSVPEGSHLALPMDRLEAAWRSDSIPASRSGIQYLLMGTRRGPVGLMAIELAELENEQRDVAKALGDQAAIAIERTTLVSELEEARVLGETEQLRSALLSSVSHDLRTPLASIIGSTSTLIEYGDTIEPKDRESLLKTTLGEAERLNRYIQNLLDMTRLGHGSLDLRRDWVDVGDLVSAAVERVRNVSGDIRVEVGLDQELPLLFVHGVFIEQALVNVLDNAIRFSPPGGLIRIRGIADTEQLMLEVCDEGPGIPEAERERIFDMFYSIQDGDRRVQGSGLGLAICRGLVGAHGGTITAAEGRDGHGTCMRISLPLNRKLQ